MRKILLVMVLLLGFVGYLFFSLRGEDVGYPDVVFSTGSLAAISVDEDVSSKMAKGVISYLGEEIEVLDESLGILKWGNYFDEEMMVYFEDVMSGEGVLSVNGRASSDDFDANKVFVTAFDERKWKSEVIPLLENNGFEVAETESGKVYYVFNERFYRAEVWYEKGALYVSNDNVASLYDRTELLRGFSEVSRKPFMSIYFNLVRGVERTWLEPLSEMYPFGLFESYEVHFAEVGDSLFVEAFMPLSDGGAEINKELYEKLPNDDKEGVVFFADYLTFLDVDAVLSSVYASYIIEAGFDLEGLLNLIGDEVAVLVEDVDGGFADVTVLTRYKDEVKSRFFVADNTEFLGMPVEQVGEIRKHVLEFEGEEVFLTYGFVEDGVFLISTKEGVLESYGQGYGDNEYSVYVNADGLLEALDPFEGGEMEDIKEFLSKFKEIKQKSSEEDGVLKVELEFVF